MQLPYHIRNCRVCYTVTAAAVEVKSLSFYNRGASAAMHQWPVLTGGWLAASSSATKLWSAHIGKSITNLTKVPCPQLRTHARTQTRTHTHTKSAVLPFISAHTVSPFHSTTLFKQHWSSDAPTIHTTCVCEREREFVCVREGLVAKMWCLPHNDMEMYADINLSSWNGAEGRDGNGKKELKERWRGDNESRGIHITFIKHTHHFLKMQSYWIQNLHKNRSSPAVIHSFIQPAQACSRSTFLLTSLLVYFCRGSSSQILKVCFLCQQQQLHASLLLQSCSFS